MNVPGRAGGNWSWRATEEMLSAPAFEALRELTRASKRLGLEGVRFGKQASPSAISRAT
jgi:hypothetical protein